MSARPCPIVSIKKNLTFLLVLTAAAACKSTCGGAKTVADPAIYVSRGAEAVVEIPDLGILAKKKNDIIASLEGVVTPEQANELLGELKRTLGFDPTTKEGLAEIGLPPEGPIAGEVVEGGRGALWILPVVDPTKLAPLVRRMSEMRQNIDRTEERPVGKHMMTVHYMKWGDQEVALSAFLVTGKTALIGAGRRGPDLITAALERKQETSVLSNPEYQALDKALGKAVVGRFIVPSATTAAGRIGRLIGAEQNLNSSPFLRSIQSAGWSARASEHTLEIDGRLRLDKPGQEGIKAFFGEKKKMPPGVLAVADPDAVLLAEAVFDLGAVVAAVAPEGSPFAQQLEKESAEITKDLGVDVKTQLLPALSGHGLLSIGIGDVGLLVKDPRAVMENPAQIFWGALALGLAQPEAFKSINPIGPRLDPILGQRGMKRSERSAAGETVTVLAIEPPPAGTDGVVLESSVAGDSWILSNDRARTDRMLGAVKSPPPDPLKGEGGLLVELRIAPIAAAVRKIDFGQIAPGIQSQVDRALTLLDRIQRVRVGVQPSNDGLAFQGRLEMAGTKK